MNAIAIIGNVAAACTTIAFFPQVVKIARTKHVADLSWPMYLIFSFGVFCWFVYGVLIKSPPVIAANGITFILAVYILAMIARYR